MREAYIYEQMEKEVNEDAIGYLEGIIGSGGEH